MATDNPLLIPLNVKAFVVNEAVRSNKGVNIQRWSYDYVFMKQFDTPEPEPFAGQNNFPGTGVVLHWELPDILRNGAQNGRGAIEFPLVPNRWLVVRYSGPVGDRTATGFVVQSDALGNFDPVNGGSPYMRPAATVMEPTFVGQVVALDDWREPDPSLLFLTAVAPGNNMFASFQPYCGNVFSIFDPLAGVAPLDTLSYFVAGWYSDREKDIVGSWRDGSSFREFLRKANWELARPSDDDAMWGLYHGMVWGVAWGLNGAAPSNVPTRESVEVAVGNTAIDALTALIKFQADDNLLVDAGLLEALQYGLLSLYDQPDAEFELAQKIEQAWFGYLSGGYGWEIVDTPVDPSHGDPPPPVSPVERAEEAEWLAALNRAQADYDQALITLASLQWDLYQVWWKYGWLRANRIPPSRYPAGTSEDEFKQALDPARPESLVSQVMRQLERIALLGATIPRGQTQDDLLDEIKKYAESHGLPLSRELKQFTRRPFTRPTTRSC